MNLSQLSRPSLAVCALSLCSTALAQSTGQINDYPARGESSSWPMGMFFNSYAVDGAGAITSQSSSTVRIKAPGDRSPAPTDAPSALGGQANGANYSQTAMFGAYPGIEIDALSTGNGVIPSPDADGVPAGSGAWMGVNVSVKHNPNETPEPAVHYGRAHMVYGTGGSEVLAYYLEQSTGIHPFMNGRAMLETTRTHSGYGSGTLDDLCAMDYGMGIFHHGTQQAGSVFFTERDLVFFSVTKQWADLPATQAAYPAFAERESYLDGSTTVPGFTAAPNATDVYVIEWDGSNWSTPKIYATGSQLGFDPAQGDLDGLDVDSRVENIVFSGSPNSTIAGVLNPDQLQIIDLDGVNGQTMAIGQSAPKVLSDRENANAQAVPVSAKLGISESHNDRDADAICIVDPYHTLLDGMVTFPRGQFVSGTIPWVDPMGLSATRFTQEDGNDAWRVQVTGFGEPGPVNGTLFLFRRPGDLPSDGGPVPRNLWFRVGGYARTTADDTVEFIIDHVDFNGQNQAFIALQLDENNNPTVSSWAGAFSPN